MSLLKLAGPSHEQMIKEAVLGALAGIGKAVLKSPMRSLGFGFDAMQVAGAVKNSRRAGLVGANMMQDAAAMVPPGSM